MKFSVGFMLLVFLCSNGVYSGGILSNDVVESVQKKLDSFLENILERLDDFKEKIEDLKEENDFLRDESNSLKEKLLHILSMITPHFKKIDNGPSSSVVFSVELSSDQSDLDVVKFDRVKTNIGNGYDENTGEFTAPEAGIYYFTTIANVKGSVGIYIRHGEKLAPANIKFSEEKQQLTTIGTNVVLDLKKGEKVWVYLRMGKLLGSTEHVFASFTGFRLA